jgi:hypothetical protein
VSESLPKLLLRRSEAGRGAALWGCDAQPHFGRAFDRLLADRVLTERAPATTWPPCRTCDAGCGPRAIAEIDGRLVAECPEDHACDTVLAPYEVRSFAIDPEALVRLIAAATGLPETPFMVTEGAWMLGRTPTTGRAIVLVLDPVAGRDPDLVALVRAEAPVGCPVTVLLPSGMEHADMRRLATAGFHAIPALDALAGAAGPAFALDGASLEPTPAREPKVILRAGARSIVLFGRTVKLSQRRFLVARRSRPRPAAGPSRPGGTSSARSTATGRSTIGWSPTPCATCGRRSHRPCRTASRPPTSCRPGRTRATPSGSSTT